MLEQNQEIRRRSSDTAIDLIGKQINNIERSLDKLTEAVTKLAVIEERQVADRAALERAFKAIQMIEDKNNTSCNRLSELISDTDDRVDALEKQAPLNNQTNKWVINFVWAAAAASAMYVAKKVGLIQ